jgi:hypothetical protein
MLTELTLSLVLGCFKKKLAYVFLKGLRKYHANLIFSDKKAPPAMGRCSTFRRYD